MSVAFSLQYLLLGNHMPSVNIQRKRETFEGKAVSALVKMHKLLAKRHKSRLAQCRIKAEEKDDRTHYV